MPENLVMLSFRISADEFNKLEKLAKSRNTTKSECLRALIRTLDDKVVEYQKKVRRPKIIITEAERLSFSYYSKLLYVCNTTVHMAQAIDDLRDNFSDVNLLKILGEVQELSAEIQLYFSEGGK